MSARCMLIGTVLGLALWAGLFAAASSASTPPLHPHPDPAPPGLHVCKHDCIIPFSYTEPAINRVTGKPVRGWKFLCRIHKDGSRSCRLITGKGWTISCSKGGNVCIAKRITEESRIESKLLPSS